MQERFDAEMMVERARDLARDIRQSDAYPAIVGGIAGGIAGAMMAALIVSRLAPRDEFSSESSDAKERKGKGPSGFNARQAMELVAVVAGLIKQAREWYDQGRKR